MVLERRLPPSHLLLLLLEWVGDLHGDHRVCYRLLHLHLLHIYLLYRGHVCSAKWVVHGFVLCHVLQREWVV